MYIENNDVNMYIIEQRAESIANDLQIMLCKHVWEKHGYGYKCKKCSEYTGLNNELNSMIKKNFKARFKGNK